MVDLSKFKELFISEAEDHLQKLNDNLLALEKNSGDKKLLNELMRSAHTMKSSSATMGYQKMAFLTHVMEDIFDYARNDTLQITPNIVNELFNTFDVLANSLSSVKKTNEETNVDAAIEKIKQLTGVVTEGGGKTVRTPAGKSVAVSPQPLTGNKKNLNENGQELMIDTISHDTVQKSETSEEAVSSSEQIDIEKISHIKVPVERLDNLMDLMEELLIDKMKLERLKSKDLELKGIVNHLSRLVSDIQYQVMQSRLVPVDQIFFRFPRMVRDLSQSQKKEVELEITGGEMELDRTIVDKLGEPLVHLLRNAVDHGIETKGVIKLQAAREKDFALITVENSGINIDFEDVKRIAVKKNIVGKQEVESMNKNQLIDLLFNNNFSTNETVTETSGRGVGLSVVKNFAEQIGGRVIVDTPLPMGGTRFTLELPLTLAIVRSLLVGVRGAQFAIPFSNIERSVDIFYRDIKSMADQEVAVVDGTHVPLVRLHNSFDLKVVGGGDTPSDNGNPSLDTQNSITVVLIKQGESMIGIVVDELVSEQEIIVKPLPSFLRGTRGFSGSTILGDGKIILILDVGSLLKEAKEFGETSTVA